MQLIVPRFNEDYRLYPSGHRAVPRVSCCAALVWHRDVDYGTLAAYARDEGARPKEGPTEKNWTEAERRGTNRYAPKEES